MGVSPMFLEKNSLNTKITLQGSHKHKGPDGPNSVEVSLNYTVIFVLILVKNTKKFIYLKIAFIIIRVLYYFFSSILLKKFKCFWYQLIPKKCILLVTRVIVSDLWGNTFGKHRPTKRLSSRC